MGVLDIRINIPHESPKDLRNIISELLGWETIGIDYRSNPFLLDFGQPKIS